MCSAEQTLCQGLTNTGPTWTIPPETNLDRMDIKGYISDEDIPDDLEELRIPPPQQDEYKIEEGSGHNGKDINQRNTKECISAGREIKDIVMQNYVKLESKNDEPNIAEEIMKPKPKQIRKSSRKSYQTMTKMIFTSPDKPGCISLKRGPKYKYSKGFDCPVCPKSYMHKHHLDRHMQQNHGHRLFISKGFDCSSCYKSYKASKNLAQHMRRIHDPYKRPVKTPKNYDCPKCTNSYKYQRGLERHLKHSCGQGALLDCPVCGKKLKQQFTLKEHLKLLHADYYKSTLAPKQLVRIVEDPANPSFVCHKCSKRYTYRKGLMRHLKLECDKEPQYECHMCLKRIRRSLTLTKHLLITHGIMDDKKMKK